MRRILVSIMVFAASTVGLIASTASPSGASVAVVSGVVRDASSAPVAGATVKLQDGSGEQASMTTPADGSFSLQVPPGSYAMSFGWLPFASETTLAQYIQMTGRSGTDLTVSANVTADVMLPAITTVHANVIDSNSVPTAGQVTIPGESLGSAGSLSNGTPMSFRLTYQNFLDGPTNGSGQFSFPALLGDTVPVTISPPGSLSTTSNITVTTDPTNVTVQLPPTVTVSGVVHDGSGSPVAGATVTLDDLATDRVTVTTAPDGSYALHVALGSYLMLFGWHPFSSEAPPNQNLQVNGYSHLMTVSGDVTANIALPAITTVHASVVDGNGAPTTGAVSIEGGLSAGSPASLSNGTPMTFAMAYADSLDGPTNSAGEFSFPALLGDTVPLTITQPATFPSTSNIHVTTDPTNATVQLPQAVTLSGVVRDGSGAAVAGAVLDLNANATFLEVTTATDGSYVAHVPAGPYTMLFQWLPFESTGTPAQYDHVVVRADMAVSTNVTANITLPPITTVHVSVMDSAGAPTAATVDLQHESAGLPGLLGDGTPMTVTTGYFDPQPEPTDSNGAFSFPALLGDTVPVTINPPAALSFTRDVEITSDPTNVAFGISYLNAATIVSVGSVGGSVSVSSPPGTRLFDVSSTQLAAGSLPAGAAALTGALSYSVDGLASGATVDVVLSLPPGSNPTGVYKLQTGTFVDVSSIATIVGNQITLHLTDGGLGDADNSDNGVIVDPLVPFRKFALPAPGNVRVVPGNGHMTVSWAAPSSNNGSPIDSYEVIPYLGVHPQAARVFNSTATSHVITGLTNGASYTFKVATHNGKGWSELSAAQSAVKVGTPVAPAKPRVAPRSTTASTGSLAVSYTAGANNGATITKFTATCASSNGGVTKSGSHVGATAAPITVFGVTTKKTYACTVRATNARGLGPPSVASTSVVVGAPAAPTAVHATKVGAGRLQVGFTPGASNGAAITKYTTSCISSNTGVTKTKITPAAANPVTVIGLTGGKKYTCTVRAANTRGTGPPSIASAVVTA